MNNSAANMPRTRNKPAANKAKKRDVSPKNKRIRDESATESPRIRYAFAPLLQQFRSHTAKNQARLWMPIETNLISRYEFATLTTHTRYIFVAILLYCAGNGIDEIPLDARFMASVLNADFRSIENSFDELLFKNLLVEKKEREEKKDTDRQTETAGAGVLCVDDSNLFQEVSDEEKAEEKTENGKPKTEKGLLKIVPAKSNGNSKHSLYSIEECLKYVEVCQSKGERIESPKALANHLHKTGEADAFIMATLYPARAEEIEREQFGAPVKFTDEPCRVCFGAKMADTDGKGFRKCAHCKDERGKSTGREPEGETEK